MGRIEIKLMRALDCQYRFGLAFFLCRLRLRGAFPAPQNALQILGTPMIIISTAGLVIIQLSIKLHKYLTNDTSYVNTMSTITCVDPTCASVVSIMYPN